MVFQNGFVELPVYFLIALVVIGGLMTWLVCRLRYNSKLAAALTDFKEVQTSLQETINRQLGELEQLTTRFTQAEKNLDSKNRELVELTGLKAAATEKAANLEHFQEKLPDLFRSVSLKVMQANNKAFMDLAGTTMSKYFSAAANDLESRQKTISTIVKPVNEALDRYDQQIRELERAREKAYGGLLQQVQSLAESQNALQRETGKLTSALSKPHVRGRWGELTLKRVAELAGMQDHCDFIEQASVNAGDGLMRPDMIIQLPAGRNIVVDSKVPLAAYLEAQAAGSTDERETLMENHVRHVQTHIRQLSKKAYWTQFQPTPEFVVLFIPGENFFSAALARDPNLIEFGAAHQIILATPTTLISLLKTIDMGWRQEALAENAKVVSALGSDLYQRLAVMTGHFKNLGRDLERATESYNKMLGSYERRVLATARKFNGLGLTLKSDTPLPEVKPVEKQPRRLTDNTLEEHDDPS
jgi:DNA recombination protein RmuC